MRCLDENLIVSFLAGRLTSDAAARVDEHVDSCASCRELVAVHDVGPFEDGLFIAMEYVDGESLAEWLKRGSRTYREVVDVFLQAGRGLAAAHAAGLVHREFKPANVLMGKDGRVRVGDFGLARLLAGPRVE